MQSSQLAAEIQVLCQEKLSIRVRSTDQDLFDSGLLDSLSLVQLILELEHHFDIQLPLDELDIPSMSSIDSIATLIERRKAASGPQRILKELVR